MIAFPNAKINLGLWILEKRHDNFHEIESCFLPVTNCCDALEVIPHKKDGSKLFLYGRKIEGNPNDNLVLKAFELVRKRYQIPFCDIHLLKNIPSKAGLGGGSSNAVSMLKLLDSLFQLRMTEKEFHLFCSRLGSDCHFFVQNQPAVIFGKGDKVSQPISIPDLKGKKLVLVLSDIDVSTPQAYQKVSPKKRNNTLQEAILNNKIETWNDFLVNDFETVIFQKHQKLASIKEKLKGLGALYVSMSGSGSAIYGIFDKFLEERLILSNFVDERVIFQTIA